MQEESQYRSSSQQTVADKLGYPSRTKPRPEKQITMEIKGQYYLIEQIMKTIKQLENLYEKREKGGDKYKNWLGTEEDIYDDKCPEFVVRDGRGFVQSADGLRLTVPVKRQRVTKYFTENPSKQDRATTHYKAWKEEEKPADGYRHFIKKNIYRHS
ncbi:MAG: hypothetical protein EZS28_010946 [Streblomastix strix]|uniref:Uncharacterized protein n=1 Tax=Streblomastix strix TaxID=222440 RepID=A0A5J4WFM8_9EUKA|nr:MAG: hypothetical protein EZS28_010946 [Streblomastix strix]